MSEGLKLKWRDVSLTHINYGADITKTSINRSVPISPKLKQILDQYRSCTTDDSGYLFPSGTSHLSFKTADKNLRWVCDYCGFYGISTHSFRRTAMTNLYKAGIPLTVIQNFTGHL